MPPRLEAAILMIVGIAVLWAGLDYFRYAVENAQAGRWVGGTVDGLIWVVAVVMTVLLLRQAARKWK